MIKKYISPILILTVMLFTLNNKGYSDRLIESEFLKRFSTWETETCCSPHSDTAYFVDHPTFQEIINLGPPALPYIFEVMNNHNDLATRYYMHIAFKRITKKEIDLSQLSVIEQINGHKVIQLWVDWWEEGRKYSEEIFQTQYDREMGGKLDHIKKIGIEGLPFAIEKVKAGDINLVEVIEFWTDDALTKNAEEKNIVFSELPDQEKIKFISEWWEENEEQWTLPEIEEQNEE